MAKGLHNLIRLHEWQVDEKRRKVGELLRFVAELEDQARRLEQELKDEQRAATGSPEVAGFFYGNYARAVIDRRYRIAETTARAEEEVTAAREELREAHAELRKYEIIQENRDKREAEELARREQAVLDELGLQGYRQRQQ